MFSKHQRAHSFGHSHKTLEWTLPLYEVYNAEINRLRVENEALRFHYQQLNVQDQAVQQENEQKIEKMQKGNVSTTARNNFGNFQSRQEMKRDKTSRNW